MAFLFLRFNISFDYIPEDIGRTREQHVAARTKDAGKCWTLKVSCYSMMLVIQRNINEIRDKEKRYPISIMANSSVINLLSGEPGWETRNFDAELQKFQEKNIKEEEIAKIFGVGKSELPLKKRMMRDMVRKLMEMAGENIQKKK